MTYEARVEDFVALQEVGSVIHPVLAAGQIEGGVRRASATRFMKTWSGETAEWPTTR